jgi:hypothetical protein
MALSIRTGAKVFILHEEEMNESCIVIITTVMIHDYYIYELLIEQNHFFHTFSSPTLV